jgi:hypothetical protein
LALASREIVPLKPLTGVSVKVTPEAVVPVFALTEEVHGVNAKSP